jgi:hypothetical protein
MKILKVLTLSVLVFTLISTMILLHEKSGVFVVLPYIILLVLWYLNKDNQDARHYSLFIVSIIVCPITFFIYRQVESYPGSSTDGLVFLVFPIYSILFIAVAYPILKWTVAKVLAANKNTRVAATIVGAAIIGWLLYTAIPGPNAYKTTRNYQKRKLTNNIDDAKKKGAFVKELHYKINGFHDLPDLKPYLEKGVKFGEDSTDFVPFVNTSYPYRLGFNRYPADSVFIYVQDEELDKFDSHNGTGSYGASGFLAKPKLPDTITLGIKKNHIVSGTIKVWD